MRSTTAPAAPGIALRRRPLGVNGDAEPLGEQLDGDVVQVRAAAGDLADERPLERARHADEHARPLGGR